jgi:predicted esterase
VGTVYPGRTADVWVILLEGFGADQVTMCSLANEFVNAGISVASFDFSGHGRSPGGLTFDNAATDRLAKQVLAARESLILYGENPKVFLVGHSLGARVALQAAVIDPQAFDGLVLLGPQVNLAGSAQAALFTGTNDLDLPWVGELGPQNPSIPILMVTGDLDDIITPESAGLLMTRLTGEHSVSQLELHQLDALLNRQWILLPGLVHNYEPFSERVIAAAVTWVRQTAGFPQENPYQPAVASLRVTAWTAGLIGFLLALVGGIGWAELYKTDSKESDLGVEIANLRRFLWGKLALWLAALPVVAVLFGIIVVLPFNYPAFNLIYFGFLGGYGLLNILLYRLGRMPGTSGRLPFDRHDDVQSSRRLFLALGLGALVLFYTAAYARTGWFYVFPLNERLIWLVAFSLVTAPGFWVAYYESRMVRRAAPGKTGSQAALILIGLTPFILWSAFLGGLGSLSGLIGGLQGLLILVLALLFGRLVQAVAGRPWLTALLQALLIFWLLLPQGALFTPGF